ncbi:MAG: hypothetical protein AABX59_03250 [Nanoarchaeota archaeon]
METITITKDEYERLLKIKNAVDVFDKMIHEEDKALLEVAEHISKRIKEGKIRLITEEEFFNKKT